MAKLGEICAFQSGGTPSKNKPEYFGGEIPWISTTALNGGKINEADAVAWITPKAIRESAAKIVPANSIMIGTRVGIGKVAINTVEMSTSQDVISLINIDEDKWYKPYLCKLLLSKKDYFNSQARGATIKGLKIDVVANIDVPEIDYTTQRKVAATLNKIDTLIFLRKQQLAKLDELVKARFVEMFGDISNSRKVPMQDVCKIITDGTHQPPKFVLSGIPFLFVSNIVTNEIHYDAEKFISEETYNELIKRTPIEVGDVLLSTVGSYGHPAVVKENKPFCFQRHIAYLKPNNSVVNSEYLRCAILSTDLQRQIDESVKGIAQKTLNLSEIRKLRLPLPSLSLQNQFAAFVERIDQQKQTVQQSLEKLELMKKALMQEYFG